ncbi:hypothetical protein FRB96_003378 [Tulasnella sp. 330]|nr:hypothetical protein FRB96_003378 [Tulasnella sp. 330]KAG8875406.1 hypothetical protein FRB97_005141 [Tulasnella sp. 331]KAG8887455.1 hypothetical protein FRB98_009599 [Tulasnella sp. 332]
MYNSSRSSYQQPTSSFEAVSGEQYRYALTNFRIAHEKVESQRHQLEEQERQVASLKARIALLEGGDEQGVGLRTTSTNQGGSSVDDFSIRTAASKLERLINRWAADIVRAPPVPLAHIRNAALADLEGPRPSSDATPVICQNLLRHAMSEAISEGIVNNLIVTNSPEANIQLTRIHEHIFARDPTVASVWRRQTFSAAVEEVSPALSQFILDEHIPSLVRLLSSDGHTASPAMMSILDNAYAFSRMLHGSRSSSGGITDAFYRAYVPELGNVLYPRQIELVKRCLQSECGEVDRVGSCIFFGLVKMTKTPENAPPSGPNGEVPELTQTVVRRAQVICECALGMVGAASGGGGGGPAIGRATGPNPGQGQHGQLTPPASFARTPSPDHRHQGGGRQLPMPMPNSPARSISSDGRAYDAPPSEPYADSQGRSTPGRPALHLNMNL